MSTTKNSIPNAAQPWNMADPTWLRNHSFSLCNVQQIQNLPVFDFSGNSFPNHGIRNKHHSSSSQKSTFSEDVCYRHDETYNMLNIIKANSCFYHPTRKFLNPIDIFIIVSVATVYCYFCKQFSRVENEKKQETDLCCFNKKINCKRLLQSVMSLPLALSLDNQYWLLFC